MRRVARSLGSGREEAREDEVSGGEGLDGKFEERGDGAKAVLIVE